MESTSAGAQGHRSTSAVGPEMKAARYWNDIPFDPDDPHYQFYIHHDSSIGDVAQHNEALRLWKQIVGSIIAHWWAKPAEEKVISASSEACADSDNVYGEAESPQMLRKVKPWFKPEINRLHELRRQDLSHKKIGKALGRSKDSVQRALKRYPLSHK